MSAWGPHLTRVQRQLGGWGLDQTRPPGPTFHRTWLWDLGRVQAVSDLERLD